MEPAKDQDTKSVKMLILFNGTGQSDKSPYLTNIVKIRDGLQTTTLNQTQTQWVFYADGIANDQEHSIIERVYEGATGATGKKREHEIYRELREQIEALIDNKTLTKGDKINISVSGFSRGAAQARDFGNTFLRQKLAADLNAKYGFSPDIVYDSAYLFDTVGDFEIPVEMPLVEEISGVDTQQLNPGYDLNTDGIRVVHLLSLDEKRRPFYPTRVNLNANSVEVIVEGDHSTVGGGHPNPHPITNLPMADIHSLKFMVRHMREHGFVFKPEFIEQYQIDNHEIIQTAINDPIKPEFWPAEEWGPRDIYVQVDGKRDDTRPAWIYETVLHHMKFNPDYRPESLMQLKEFYVYKTNGTLELYTPEKLVDLLQGNPIQTNVPRQATNRDNLEEPKELIQCLASNDATELLTSEDTVGVSTSSATRVEPPISSLFKAFNNWFSPSSKPIDSICVPNAHSEEGGFYCQAQHFNAHVFPKQSTQDSLTTQLNAALNTPAGDTYDVKGCQGTEYAGRPSLICEGESTVAVLTDYDKPRPFEHWGSNIALGFVLGHVLKNTFNWAKDKVLGTQIQQPKSTPIAEKTFNNATIKLQNQLKRSEANIQRYAKNQPDFFVKAKLSDIDNFQQDILKLQKAYGAKNGSKKVSKEQVLALKRDINYFTRAMAKEFCRIPQSTVQANHTKGIMPLFSAHKAHPTPTDYAALMTPSTKITMPSQQQLKRY